jgi:hypothetical protein
MISWKSLIMRSFIIFHKTFSDNKINNDKMSGACSLHGRGEKWIQNLVTEPKGNVTLVKSRRRWEDNTKYRCEGVD